MKIAIAVDHQDNIQSGHFGEAISYKIYQKKDDQWQFADTLQNDMRNYDEDQHGSKGKGKGVVKLLATRDIKAVVSKQFGQNIKIVGQYFAPIVTSVDSVAEFLELLNESTCNRIYQKNKMDIKPLRIP